MKIIYEREITDDKPSLIGSVSVGNEGKTARVYPKNAAKDLVKIHAIFNILEDTKKEIEAVLDEGE